VVSKTLSPSIEKRLNISLLKLHFFRRYASRFLAKNFHVVRLLNLSMKDKHLPDLKKIAGTNGPIIIAANHPSWWDPIIAIFLGARLGRKQSHFAPIEDAMLQRYGVFRNLGFYGIQKNSFSGLKDFLAIGNFILEKPDSVIWMTPQGDFVDPRVKPLKIKKGLANLATKHPQATILPLGLEYIFWNDKKPEILLNFGTPFQAEENQSPADFHERIEHEMTATIEKLKAASIRRNTDDFISLLGGSAGVGGFYGWLQRMRGYKNEHSS